MHDVLIELGCEEIPAKQLENIANQFIEQIKNQLQQAELSFNGEEVFATPRRLAVIIKSVQEKQADKLIERKGPSQVAAYDANGQPTKALLGFVQSCGVALNDLSVIETEKGAWLIYKQMRQGQIITDLLPSLIEQAIVKIAVPKPMRWHDGVRPFIRPIRWVVALYNDKPVHGTVMGLPIGNTTHGHRVYAPKPIEINKSDQYADLLKNEGFVLASFTARCELINEQIQAIAAKQNAKAIIDNDLLTEVTGLVEWPVALLVSFDKAFLKLPKEVLITSMKTHQKSFAIEDKEGKLLPYFITIANMQSDDPTHIINGNQKVMTARLSDAKFFYETDEKHKLQDYLPKLDQVLFQKELGSVGDKTRRVVKLANYIAECLKVDSAKIKQAAELCKCDLLTDMVGEFPELQGIMGHYYAEHDGEDSAVALAIEEHYLPRFAGDKLPTGEMGRIVGLADRIDTLVGFFSIGQKPTGDKDPYALRRTAIGLLRLLEIEDEKAPGNFHWLAIFDAAYNNYNQPMTKNIDISQDVFDFVLERLKMELLNDYRYDVVEAIFNLPAKSGSGEGVERNTKRPYDIIQRVKALQHFIENPAHHPLLAACKRIANILQKQAIPENASIDPQLLSEEGKKLYALAMDNKALLMNEKNHAQALKNLMVFSDEINKFFDTTLVMDEDEKVRKNNLAFLNMVHQYFKRTADFSCLQV